MRHDIAQKESRGSCLYHNPSPPPSVNVGRIRHWLLTTRLGSTLNWGNGVTFLLNQVKCVSIFSMIVAHIMNCIKDETESSEARQIFFAFGLFIATASLLHVHLLWATPSLLYFSLCTIAHNHAWGHKIWGTRKIVSTITSLWHAHVRWDKIFPVQTNLSNAV